MYPLDDLFDVKIEYRNIITDYRVSNDEKTGIL